MADPMVILCCQQTHFIFVTTSNDRNRHTSTRLFMMSFSWLKRQCTGWLARKESEKARRCKPCQSSTPGCFELEAAMWGKMRQP
jgi:hypothetical protein